MRKATAVSNEVQVHMKDGSTVPFPSFTVMDKQKVEWLDRKERAANNGKPGLASLDFANGIHAKAVAFCKGDTQATVLAWHADGTIHGTASAMTLIEVQRDPVTVKLMQDVKASTIEPHHGGLPRVFTFQDQSKLKLGGISILAMELTQAIKFLNAKHPAEARFKDTKVDSNITVWDVSALSGNQEMNIAGLVVESRRPVVVRDEFPAKSEKAASEPKRKGWPTNAYDKFLWDILDAGGKTLFQMKEETMKHFTNDAKHTNRATESHFNKWMPEAIEDMKANGHEPKVLPAKKSEPTLTEKTKKQLGKLAPIVEAMTKPAAKPAPKKSPSKSVKASK